MLTAPRRRWHRRIWVWIVVLLLVLIAVWIWRHHAQEAQGGAATGIAGKRAGYKGSGGGGGRRGAALGPNDVMPVGVATTRIADVPLYLSGLGSITPIATVNVRPRVDGLLTRLNFREGQIVRPGEVLAEIDPRPFQVVVEQAAGTMARDEALLANARLDFDRYRKLVEQDSIATQQLDTQRSLVSQLQGTVKGDRGNLDSARLQLSFTRITAPVGGRVGLRQVDLGNIVHASDTTGIVVITQLQPIDVVFALPEIYVQRIMKRIVSGATLPVDALGRDDQKRLSSGSLITVDNQIDVATGTVKLKARFANAGYELFPNQFVNARLLLDVQRGATVIPPAAVQRGAQGFYVYVVNGDNTVTAHNVTLGIATGDQQVIDTGVNNGELVVVDGTDKLRDGAKVEPVARDGAAVPASAPGSAATPASTDAQGASSRGGSPDERRKRWEAIDKRIDAGEFGEEIKKLPEDQRKERMRELRGQRQGSGTAPSAPPQ